MQNAYVVCPEVSVKDLIHEITFQPLRLGSQFFDKNTKEILIKKK